MSKVEDHRCLSCQVVYEVLVHGAEVLRMSDDGPGECPACGSPEFEVAFNVPLGVDLGDVGGAGRTFPYFDRAIVPGGMEIRSAAHRRKVMKRMGVVPADGDLTLTLDAQLREDNARDDRARTRYAALKQRYAEDPAFADYRRMQDLGILRDQSRNRR